MKTATLDKLTQLQKRPSSVRNICILAHVDHGKTTLADALVASNGIISQRMAGKLRYLDSREDEQTRGITMKSSAISLHFQNEGQEEFLVNLIDSPGHVDFSSEVSTAVRLCDGAIVIVDVVEGVCPQTHAVLRQAWLENIKPVLVLNKIDRLVLELKMEPLEAFIHLQQILEQVNVVTSELFTADIMSMETDADADGTQAQNHDWTESADELEHKNIYFSPDQGNVVFACAYDSWGFTIGQFAEIFSKKLGMNKQGLLRTLWGDFYLNTKAKRIVKGAQSKGKKPLFVQFILENVWSVYEAVMVRRDKEMIEKIVSSLGLKILPRDVRSNDPRVHLQAIMGQWLPVSKAVLTVVTEKLPSPLNIIEEKVEKLMCNRARRFDSMPKETQQLKQAFLECNSSDDVPVIVFVSKMFPVEKSALPQNKQKPLTDEELQKRREAARLRHAAKMAAAEAGHPGNEITTDDGVAMATGESDQEKDQQTDTDQQVFVAFARVYSGTVRTGQKLYVLGPKHDPAIALQKIADGSHIDSSATLNDLVGDEHMTVVTVTDLYMFMGRELEQLECVPAGNVLGIGGLEDHILKSGTLSSAVACPAFTDLYFDAFPILRVALEPTQAGEMGQLVRGLRLLNQADPCVQVLVQETGEHVIITAGEVHLRRCLDDLEQRYAKIKVIASSPIVPFRETIVLPPTVDMVNEAIQEQNMVIRNDRTKEFENDEEIIEEGVVRIFTPKKDCMIQVRTVPLPLDVVDFLDSNQFLIKTLDLYVSSKVLGKGKSNIQEGSKLKQSTKEEILEFKNKLEELFVQSGKKWKDIVDKIWAFGPKRIGPNLLVNHVEGYNRVSIWDCIRKKNDDKVSIRDYDYSVVSGFQLATLVGPLCDEPVRGVCYIVEKWDVDLNRVESKILGGGVMKAGQDGTVKVAKEKDDCSKDIELKLSNLTVESKGSENLSQEVSDVTSLSEDRRSRQRKISVKFGIDDSDDSDDNIEDNGSVSSGRRGDVQGHTSGQLISIMKEACRKSFQTQPQRLMVAMYKCTIQATAEVLGKLYGVIGKRNGRILGEDMREGSQMFNIEATIPVVESFGFSEDIRKKTSGLASPQLVFSHWEVVDVDPFWVPTTEEEIMHYGDKADSENRARVYMNNVRQRKGLKVDKKIVEHAEKQRTLTKNK